ncbi:hypothetical protein T4B_10660 [Trichinella pseudospiralis]|uniref:Uncharacterized protein n=1 Tax=Trichinella pseudospiralis TaxID=6337 RepID=A0A0V1EAX6_TRIPS|nr:hypothetical protein T4A_12769 [Trichinella pseudospiralis]KRZ20976.1 hypothetical protein T4B_10660 [Trichinella pseudospiralis]KRZ28017.1 hypothetical protein T4C_10972 [Trichinella pseudospiralis]
MRKDAKLKTSKLKRPKFPQSSELIENSTDGRKRLRIIIEKRRISITWMCSSVELHAYNAQFFRMNKFIENSQHFSPNRKDTKIKINKA